MDKQDGCKHDMFQVGTVWCGMFMGLMGVALAFMFLFLGFWKTLFVAVFFTVGFVTGAVTHKVDWIKKLINKLFPQKGK